MSHVAKLAGVELSAHGPVSWSLKTGAVPFVQTFTMHIDRAREVLGVAEKQDLSSGDTAQARGGLDLFIQPAGKSPLTVKQLYVIESVAGSDPYTLGIAVADRRYLWTKRHVSRSYNIRRNTGETRLVGNNLVAAQYPKDIEYAPWSLKAGNVPWTAADILFDLLKELDTPVAPTKIDRNLVVENFEVDGNGSSAIAKLLGQYLPGISLYVDPSGVVRIVDVFDGGEADMAKLPVHVGRGYRNKIRRSMDRPSQVDVYFTYESEIRFDFDEDTQGDRETRTVQGVRGKGIVPPRELDNVIPVTDPTITINGKEVHQGTWVPVGDILAAWKNSANNADAGTPDDEIDQALIRRHAFNGMHGIQNLVAYQDDSGFNPVWSRRINALKDHWRRTYRVSAEWNDLIKAYKPYRAAVLDSENGLRQEAQVWMDTVVKPSRRGLRAQPTNGNDAAVELSGYAEIVDGDDSKPAPAVITILDQDAGIVRIDPKVDPWGRGVDIVPGSISGTVPNSSPADTLMIWETEAVKLDSGFKLALVLSAVRAAPNTTTRLYKRTIPARDALKLLGQKAAAANAITRGPDAQLRVNAGMLTAWTAWKDDQASAISDAFVRGNPIPGVLVMNPEQLDNVASAMAAAYMSARLDRVEGSFTTPWNVSLRPVGSVQTIAFLVTESGETSTRVEMPAVRAPVNVSQFLDDGTRRIVERMVQP